MTLPLDVTGAREYGSLVCVTPPDGTELGRAKAVVAMRAAVAHVEAQDRVVEWLDGPHVFSTPYLWRHVAHGWWGIGRVEET